MNSVGGKERGGAAVVMAIVLVLSGAAHAVTASIPGPGPCENDAKRFCKDTPPGGGRVFRCLQEHQPELSPACRQHMGEMQHEAQEFREACQDDVVLFCVSARPGGGRIIDCLKQHERELTPGCRELVR
jgi:Cysteine rich repeat